MKGRGRLLMHILEFGGFHHSTDPQIHHEAETTSWASTLDKRNPDNENPVPAYMPNVALSWLGALVGSVGK